ncbi:hypothetical protein [Paracoccus methylarcula]|uniref:hypothetical protein n=1 Tax=Paracoccus methylarcula TaxID=72022 RepID=UPI0011CD70A9|nr:hypothetical protein [Paracoccus methylarcula]
MNICTTRLYIVPLDRITELKQVKLLPAKGGGGSYLSAIYRSPNTAGKEREINLSSSYGDPDALDEITEQISTAIDRPVRRPPPRFDY